jgi:Fe-S-cluster containining protein
MATPQDILDRYSRLTDYCDSFWKRVVDRFPDQFACAPGCGTCCTLTSVNKLEAAIITDHCDRDTGARQKPPPHPTGEEWCPFLTDDRCRIYAARPLICRTHGLLLRSTEFTERIAASCPYNFVTVDFNAVGDEFALDVEKISLNLARLNAAWCMVTGMGKDAGERVRMAELAKEKVEGMRDEG